MVINIVVVSNFAVSLLTKLLLICFCFCSMNDSMNEIIFSVLVYAITFGWINQWLVLWLVRGNNDMTKPTLILAITIRIVLKIKALGVLLFIGFEGGLLCL